MKRELVEALERDFPGLLRGRGIECRDGWEPIIRRFCETLAKTPGAHVELIKEKFGGMRLHYVTTERAEALAAEREAEADAWKTCEACGAPGAPQRSARGWVRTLCAPCMSISS